MHQQSYVQKKDIYGATNNQRVSGLKGNVGQMPNQGTHINSTSKQMASILNQQQYYNNATQFVPQSNNSPQQTNYLRAYNQHPTAPQQSHSNKMSLQNNAYQLQQQQNIVNSQFSQPNSNYTNSNRSHYSNHSNPTQIKDLNKPTEIVIKASKESDKGQHNISSAPRQQMSQNNQKEAQRQNQSVPNTKLMNPNQTEFIGQHQNFNAQSNRITQHTQIQNVQNTNKTSHHPTETKMPQSHTQTPSHFNLNNNNIPQGEPSKNKQASEHTKTAPRNSVKSSFINPEQQRSTFTGRSNVKSSLAAGINYSVKQNMSSDQKHVTGVQGFSNPGQDNFGNSKDCQDTYFILRNINNVPEFNTFGVLDGHGQNGQKASHFVRDYIKNILITDIGLANCKTHEQIYWFLKGNNYSFINKLYSGSEEHLKSSGFDCNFSGTTCVIVFQIGSHLICSNCGDSRAVLVTSENKDNGSKQVYVYNLSEDHKPNLPHEKERIEKYGGEVRQLDNNGPFRVFEKGKGYPGLAMSRSIGDFYASNLGAVSVPNFREFNMDEKAKFLIICCDGIWDHITYEMVINLGTDSYKKNEPKKLCVDLINHAIKLWRQNGLYVDDITVVTVFFN